MPNLCVICYHCIIRALSSVALLFAHAARRILQVQQNLRVPLQPFWKGIYLLLMFKNSISSFSLLILWITPLRVYSNVRWLWLLCQVTSWNLTFPLTFANGKIVSYCSRVVCTVLVALVWVCTVLVALVWVGTVLVALVWVGTGVSMSVTAP